MLRITIELVPLGQEPLKETLSKFEIVNTGRKIGPETVYHVRKNRTSPPVATYTHEREQGLNRCVERALAAISNAGLDKI